MSQQQNAPTDTKSKKEKVWDIYIRLFHWSLVFFFTIAFLTEDDWQYTHTYAGYAVTGLLLFRIIWGMIGTRYARFDSVRVGPGAVAEYLKSLLTKHPKHYVGHNPAGSVMVILLIVTLLLTALTGMVTLATEGLGPLANTFLSGVSEDWMEEAHEVFANTMLLLIALHVLGVIVSSILHQENLIRAMLDGYKHVVIKESQHEKSE